jgi:hypothetical protein
MPVFHLPPPCPLWDAWRLPPGLASPLGICALGLLGSPSLAARTPQPDRRPPRSRKKYNMPRTCPPIALDSELNSHAPSDRTLVLRHPPLPVDLESGFQEDRLDIPTSCVSVGLLYLLASQQHELRSAGPAPPTAASSCPDDQTKTAENPVPPSCLGPRSIKPPHQNPLPLFNDLSGP